MEIGDWGLGIERNSLNRRITQSLNRRIPASPSPLVPRSSLPGSSFLVPDSPAADGFFKAWLTLETAHSMPPESAGSRSPGWRCRVVGVASTGSAQPFFACGVLILLNCRHTLCCTAEWWRRECAGEAGRSRRPRQWGVSSAGSTRFHQTEMVRPAVGAATTERWSVRGPGVRLHRLPLKLQKPHQTG